LTPLICSDGHSLVTTSVACSGYLRRPALLAGHVLGPTLAAGHQMLAVGDQPLVQLAGEHRDAVHARVVPEPVTGHADLAAAGLEQGAFIEIGPVLDLLLAGALQTGERDRFHDNHDRRTPVLAGDALGRQGFSRCSPGAAPGRSQSSRGGTSG
jgi:hypothetical protein